MHRIWGESGLEKRALSEAAPFNVGTYRARHAKPPPPKVRAAGVSRPETNLKTVPAKRGRKPRFSPEWKRKIMAATKQAREHATRNLGEFLADRKGLNPRGYFPEGNSMPELRAKIGTKKQGDLTREKLDGWAARAHGGMRSVHQILKEGGSRLPKGYQERLRRRWGNYRKVHMRAGAAGHSTAGTKTVYRAGQRPKYESPTTRVQY